LQQLTATDLYASTLGFKEAHFFYRQLTHIYSEGCKLAIICCTSCGNEQDTKWKIRFWTQCFVEYTCNTSSLYKQYSNTWNGNKKTHFNERYTV